MIFFGKTRSLSRSTEHHPCWHSQTSCSNYLLWKNAFWWEQKLYILWEHVKWCKAFDMSNTCCSCLRIKEGVSLVWPMCYRDIVTCSLFNFLKAQLHSPKVSWILKSLLWMLSFQHYCHFAWRNLLILGFQSVYGILNLSGDQSKADLAANPALSFPPTPM